MAANLREIKGKIVASKKVVHIEFLKEIESLFKEIEKGEEYDTLLNEAINNNYPELAQYLKDLAALKLIENLVSCNPAENSDSIQTDWQGNNVETIGENPDHPITVDY